MTMQCKHFLLLIITTLSLTLRAQELRVNERGEKIIVHPDGTWQYFTNFGVPTDALFDPKDSRNYKPSETGDKYPTFTGMVLPMDNVYATTDEDARKIFIRRSQVAGEAVQIANQRASEATQQRKALELELRNAQNSGANEETIHNLNARLAAAHKTEQEASKEAALATQEANKTQELTQKGNYLQELKSEQTIKISRNAASEPLLEDFYKNVVTLDESTGSVRDANNVMANPPQNVCEMAFEGNDETTRQWRRDMQQELLFTHTDERLRAFLKDKEYLRCEGFMTSMSGFRFLSLQFTFAYPNAREAYGFIEKGSVLIIKLLNGDFITLNAGRMDKGTYDTEKELLTYSVHYPIDRSQLSVLRNGELDSMIMFWSSGYEEYEVFNLDFFMNQLNCLEK
ncbi:MAG: hypothetical protein SFU99_21425 [Saprospiraceae bacterium]|nr:hypothetical protein [Saprospiraceae bacterium]